MKLDDYRFIDLLGSRAADTFKIRSFRFLCFHYLFSMVIEKSENFSSSREIQLAPSGGL